jgi:hypothetical protein
VICDKDSLAEVVWARSIFSNTELHPLFYDEDSMKRIFVLILAALVVAALIGGLVHAVLVAANLSEPAASTVYGVTSRRLWATAAVGLALCGVAIGGLSLARSAGRIGLGNGRAGPIMSLVAGLLAAINGVMNLAMAKGGPGSGNGVVGGAAAVVLGVVAIALAGLTLARFRRTG